jgi:RNA polymerase sigma-70 factor (ECF subfamily)
MLVGIARAEAFRRRPFLPGDVVADLDDLCLQAAHDAMAAILAKLDSFRGASRFTTWAYKFALLEVSVRLRRRAWSTRRVALDEVSWGRLADRAPGAEQATEQGQLLQEVRKLVETTLTEKQRSVLLAVAAEEVPIDVIAERTGSSRGAVYKVLHDARRKLRESLALTGHLEAE